MRLELLKLVLFSLEPRSSCSTSCSGSSAARTLVPGGRLGRFPSRGRRPSDLPILQRRFRCHLQRFESSNVSRLLAQRNKLQVHQRWRHRTLACRVASNLQGLPTRFTERPSPRTVVESPCCPLRVTHETWPTEGGIKGVCSPRSLLQGRYWPIHTVQMSGEHRWTNPYKQKHTSSSAFFAMR